MKKRLLALLLCLSILFLTACETDIGGDLGQNNSPQQSQGNGNSQSTPGNQNNPGTGNNGSNDQQATDPGNQGNTGSSDQGNTGSGDQGGNNQGGNPGAVEDLGDDNKTFGDSLDELHVYDGYFEGASTNLIVECLSGTKNAYKLQGTTLTFTGISEKSSYSISGSFRGNIVIDVGDDYKFELEMQGLSIVCNSESPIVIKSGDKVTVKAKKDTKNYIYDMRAAVDSSAENVYSGAIHSEVDLEISGKGELFVISENNNGIHTKDDLEVKNLSLIVACRDNALKGNDSVTVSGGVSTLIATVGDGIKTSNSDISEKGNQRGTVSITGGTHTIYAACDGIDAAYDVIIDDPETVINIFTDKYSNYSDEVTATSGGTKYIRYSSKSYYYSVKYYNSESDFVWVNAEYHSAVSGGRTTYYYYTYQSLSGYEKVQFFVYQSASQQSQDSTYLYATDLLTPSTANDTLAISKSGTRYSYSWTNYTTQSQGGFPGGPGGPGGGFNDGNTDKGDHSTKGIKAANLITVNSGTINIKAYDDAIHSGDDVTLENGASPLGNLTVNGGIINVYSNDDGLHADGLLSINGGTVNVTNAYEGLEGMQVSISGGNISVNSKDDGINATTQSGTAISISGGTVYIYCTGDGIDSNSRTANVGIVISGGHTVVISNSGMNSALDTENGYSYTGGSLIAIMPQSGMTSETTHCSNFSSIGTKKSLSLSNGGYLVATIGNETATVKMPVTLSAYVVILGSNSASITSSASTSESLDANGVCWN